ncbi:hypothetical protein IJH02_00625 [Candidatus Saccharibacteria bacterium]|nr:hypothetical protein [Candidatus Saccharibacteria bacterium]
MNKKLQRVLAISSLGVVCAGLGLTITSTANAATGRGRYSGGSCSSASAACYHGAGWIYYEYTDKKTEDKAIVPNARSWWDESRLVKVKNICRNYDGFYALVRFETESGTGDWTGYGATSTQVKHVRWQSDNNRPRSEIGNRYIFWNTSQSDTSPYETDLGIDFMDSKDHSWSNPLRAKQTPWTNGATTDPNPITPNRAFTAYQAMKDDDEAFGKDSSGKPIKWNGPNSELGWFCYGRTKGNFYSRARIVNLGSETVSTETDSSRWYNNGENKSKEVAVEVPADQDSKDITFNFVLGIRTTQEKYKKFKNTNAQTTYTVTKADNWNMDSSSRVDKSTIKLTDMGKVDGSYNDDSESYVWNKVLASNTQTVKINPGEYKVICEKIEYSTKTFTIGEGSKISPVNDSANSKICVKLHRPDPKGDPGDFYSQSSVGDQTTGKDEKWGPSDSRIKTIEMDPGQSSQTVTFSHRIGSDVDDETYNKAVAAGASTTWTVVQSNYSTGNVANGIISMSSLSQEGSTHVATVNINSVNVSVAQNSTVTVCQTIQYQTKNFNIRSTNNVAWFLPNGDTGYSTICIKLRRPPPPTYCTQIFSDAKSTANYGNTLARSQVTNYTNGSTWKGEVYAKPGDEIQFRHALCFGAQAVTGSGRDGYGLDQYTTSRKRASSFDNNIFPNNEFYLSGYSHDDYLFNRSNLTATQSLQQNEKGLAKPTSFYDRFKPEEIFYDYGFQMYSPKNQATGGFNASQNLNQYSGFGCVPGVNGWNWGLGMSNTYRIPGFANDKKCQQAYGGIDSTNAGQTLAQTLNYRKIDAWIAYAHDKNSADCGSSNNCGSYRDREAVCEYNSTGNSSCDYSYLAPRYNSIINVHLGSVGEAYNYRGWKWGYLEQECDSQQCEKSGWQISWTTKKDEDGYEYNDNYKATLHTGCSLGYHSGSKTSDSWYCSPNEKSVSKLKYNAPGRKGSSPTYSIRFDDYWTETSAKVKVPYNFTTTTKSSIRTGGDVVHAGEAVDSSYTVTANKRLNPGVDANKQYLTMTPRNTVVRFISFIVDKDYDAGDGSALKGGVTTFPSNGQWGNNDVVSYYKNKLGSHMISEPERIISDRYGAINPDGELYSIDGVDESGSRQTYSQSIPDVEPGSKYCVAVGVWHADSHGITSKKDLTVGEVEGVSGYAMNGASPYWRVSSASCRTIAKKPNFQAWGGFYTQGNITTSQSNKTRVGKLFGSWTDTLAVVGGNSRGFASGASLGYINTGGAEKNTAYCKLVSVTISNSQCASNSNSKSVGLANYGYVPSTGILAQVRNRYTPSDKSAISGDYYSTLQNSDEVLYEYYKTSTYINLGSIIQNQHPGDKGKTRIIEIDGNVRINGNICVGSGTCSDINSALRLQSRNSEVYQGGGDIPQIIIIANNIKIAPEVTQIDAWLFARGSTGNENQANFGDINTCDAGHGSADVCTKTIIFNGPVFAKTLTLNRTAGAYPGVNSIGKIKYNENLANTGSITPAEIFNLRPDAYYWAYNQANRLSQATIVYMRELAPRF